MDLFGAVLSGALLLAGSLFALVGGIGILRLPDLFTRLHAAGITDTMGAGLILAGLTIHGGMSLVTVKLVLILCFLWYSSPVSTYALARAALAGGQEPFWAEDLEIPTAARIPGRPPAGGVTEGGG